MHAFILTEDDKTDGRSDGRTNGKKTYKLIELQTISHKICIQADGHTDGRTHIQTISELVDRQTDRNIHKSV